MKTPTNRQIAIFTPALSELHEFLLKHFIDTLGLNEKYIKDVLQKHFSPEILHLRNDLHPLVELPYVDKVYRDTYYHYYASRLKQYQRDTIRISFFDHPISPGIQPSEKEIQRIIDSYVGFLIIRPTLPRLIGRSAIHPRALRNDKFICCRAPIRSTALGIKVTTPAFPHASQDGQALSCAETTIWSMLEYFGNKYPEYSPILPSNIIGLLQKFSFKRQLPSDGLTAEQIAFVVREVGFGAMIYSRSKHQDQFNIALSMFIESGIPVIGVLKSPTIGHAVNIIGRQIDDRRKLFAGSQILEETGDLLIHDFHKMPRQYVFIDDNLPPYQLASIEAPCKNYGNEDWEKCELATIIVPLYTKVYLDAIRARKNFLIMLQDRNFMALAPREPVVFRAFLASSRSYKDYLAKNDQINPDARELMLLLAMPKFIWVAEICSEESFGNHQIIGLMLQDATDPVEYSAGSASKDISVFFGLYKNRFFTILDGNIHNFDSEGKSFPEYCYNLT
jgi:hypothetical protein